MDDLDWVRDVSSDFMSFLKQYQSEGDIYKVWVEGISMEDQLTMMDKLYDHGFQWRGGHGRYDTSFVNIPILYLETDTMEIQWDSGEDNRDTFEDREYETPKTQIPTDDFFNALGMSVSNINESDELEWVKDVKSNQDIAQELADETKIKNDLLHTPFSSFLLSFLSSRFSLPSPPSFTKYGKEQYGLDNEDDINDVWERYKKLVRDKVNSIPNKIIREEINNDLLMESKLKDMFKKFNMTQIKKELKERLDIDETSTKMEVAKKLIKYSYKLNLKLLKYELGAVLGGFIFYFLSIVLDMAGVEPFVTDGEPTMPHFILWGAGALLNVIRMVRKDLNESNNFDWVRDIKPTMTNIYGNEIPINTKEAQDNFKKEVNGNYVISTPIENTDEETVLAFGSVSYIKSVIYHIHKNFPEDQALYFGTIKYSKKEKDNVLSYIRYY